MKKKDNKNKRERESITAQIEVQIRHGIPMYGHQYTLLGHWMDSFVIWAVFVNYDSVESTIKARTLDEIRKFTENTDNN